MNKIYLVSAPQNIINAVKILSEYFPDCFSKVSKDAVSLTVTDQNSETCLMSWSQNQANIANGTITKQLRAIGELIAGNIPKNTNNYKVDSHFSTIGIMLDASRNGVMKPSEFKRWICALSLLGMNQIMLYTEDTYEIKGQDRFGYLRGRYTENELRDLDKFAKTFELEIVGCIQTLGHLEQIARWDDYKNLFDLGSTLLVGNEDTYKLIENMISSIKNSLSSSRIHIGMDEAWQLGRGKHLDLHGHRSHFDLFNEHLTKVTAICEKNGLQPMIWSDMFFTTASPTHTFYDVNAVFPDDVLSKIPKQTQLVYWDYYHNDKETYLRYIKRHREINHEPIMASGVWTWGQLWYNRKITEANVTACLDACIESGVKELFFTMWGDDGAYCDYDSSIAGLTFAAEKAYHTQTDDNNAANIFKIFTNGHDYYSDNIKLSDTLCENEFQPSVLLWDDLLLGIFMNEVKDENISILNGIKSRLKDTIRELNGKKYETTTGGDFECALSTAKLLLRKINLREKLVLAYDNKDTEMLQMVAFEALMAADLADTTENLWRRSWMRRNKPEGYEILQIRLAGISKRLREAAQRIEEFLNGEAENIPELENRPTKKQSNYYLWNQVASGSINI